MKKKYERGYAVRCVLWVMCCAYRGIENAPITIYLSKLCNCLCIYLCIYMYLYLYLYNYIWSDTADLWCIPDSPIRQSTDICMSWHSKSWCTDIWHSRSLKHSIFLMHRYGKAPISDAPISDTKMPRRQCTDAKKIKAHQRRKRIEVYACGVCVCIRIDVFCICTGARNTQYVFSTHVLVSIKLLSY